jgi:hypothetical protein
VTQPISFTGIKLKFLDLARRDKTLSHFEYRLLDAIASCVDRESGDAIRNREQLAREIGGCSVRAIEKAVARLEARQLIEVKRGRGRGVANVYRLRYEKANRGSPISPSTESENANGCSPIEDLKKANGSVEKGEREGVKRRTAVRPLPYISHLSLPPGVMDRLRNSLGKDVASAWFGQATIERVDGSGITIGLPTRFIRERIQRDYHDQLVAALSAERQAEVSVQLIVQPSRSVNAERPRTADKRGAGAQSATTPAQHVSATAERATPALQPKLPARIRSIARLLPG